MCFMGNENQYHKPNCKFYTEFKLKDSWGKNYPKCLSFLEKAKQYNLILLKPNECSLKLTIK